MSRKLIALALARDFLTILLWTSWYGREPCAYASGQCSSHAATIRLGPTDASFGKTSGKRAQRTAN